MPPIGAYRQALEPFRAVNRSVGPFISDFRSQVRISDLALLDLPSVIGGCDGRIRAASGLYGSVTAGKLWTDAGEISNNVGA